MAQALVAFLKNQYVVRDDCRARFFAGAWGIFGHGNVAGIGEALQTNPDFRYFLCRNEQAMGHTATAFAKANNRLRTFACTSSIGPGATNMLTSAATATINRLPLLLLPGDIFARRNVGPVLQQLETGTSLDVSVNDAFKPLCRYWDRINRADQLPFALTEAMRVLTSPAETGTVTLALPQDVQTEAWDYPEELFAERTWRIPRTPGDPAALREAAAILRRATCPLIIAGGGVLYSEASNALAAFCERTGIAVGETQAGKGSLRFDHPCNLGAIGATGTPGANRTAVRADVVIAIGTRLSDFTTASKTAFQHPGVRFININVSDLDAGKHSALPIVADARAALEQLSSTLQGYRVSADYSRCVEQHKREWEDETDRLYRGSFEVTAQSEVIGVVNGFSAERDVVVAAAGSLPGDLHKLWRTRDAKGYHMEYGYSCMGYEVAGGLGVKMADPTREVFVMIGDGSYLMMSSEIATAIQEDYKLNIVLLNNNGFSSIGGLSHSVGSSGFGTRYRYRNPESGQLDGGYLPIDYAANAASLGAKAVAVRSAADLRQALEANRTETRTTVFVVDVDRDTRVGGYDSWWDVPVAEISEIASVRDARRTWETMRKRERIFL